MIVFLWLGNVVMGQVDITNSTTPGAWVGDSWETQDPWYIAPDVETFEMDTNQTTDWSPDTFCNIEGSKYFWDPNAILSSTLLSCKCKPWFGDSDTATTPNICQLCTRDDICCGIKLNTKVPFIGNCIEDENYGGVSSEKAFPTLMWALTQILVTIILIVSFVLIVVGGIMIATGNPSGGKKMIMKVVVGIALLGASGVILRLINPNFFG